MMVFVDFCCILQHLPCILLQIVLRFGAYCTAFWCKLHCVLVQNALQLIKENEEKSKLLQTN